MSKKVYVPLIIYKCEDMCDDAFTCGVFVNKRDAANALIDNLIRCRFLDYRVYAKIERTEYDSDSDTETDECNNLLNEFAILIKSKVNKDVSNLDELCEQYGNSFWAECGYLYTWDFKMSEHIIS